MSNSTNGISTEMASQLAEAAQLLKSAADKLSDAADELEGLDYPHEYADSWPEDVDSLLDPEDYLTVLEVSGLARYYMPRENAESIPVPKLQKLLYKVSVADGYPIMLRDQELAFHTDIAVTCLKKIKVKVDSVKDLYMPSVLEGEDEF